ncbi:MAG: hypothetical protein HOV94_33765 [Saccharothrix sp.]|nr:hypothetical protein [Saccharothrix sp.]
MDNPDIPQGADGEQEQPEEARPNRAARRGHAAKNQGVQKIPGRPHQNTFVGRRVFRRTGG